MNYCGLRWQSGPHADKSCYTGTSAIASWSVQGRGRPNSMALNSSSKDGHRVGHWDLEMSTATVAIKSKIKAFLLNNLRLQIRRLPKRGEESFPDWIDPDFPRLFKKYHRLTMVSWQGLYWSWLAAKYIDAHKIPGDVVECGVFKGGC